MCALCMPASLLMCVRARTRERERERERERAGGGGGGNVCVRACFQNYIN